MEKLTRKIYEVGIITLRNRGRTTFPASTALTIALQAFFFVLQVHHMVPSTSISMSLLSRGKSGCITLVLELSLPKKERSIENLRWEY
jgi:hypothetical protein